MSVPNTFASATSAIPLANLDADFAYYDAAFQIAAGVMEVNYTFRLEDTTDTTKKAEFVMSGITTGTTRQYTLPNVTGSLASLGNISQTFTGSTSIVPATNGSAITIGAIPQTGTITLGRSTAAQTVDIAVGATAAATTKTVNIGTTGVSTSTTNLNYGSAVTGALVTHIWNAGANNMRLDSAGNLGLGVTPSAWSGYKAIQFAVGSGFVASSDAAYRFFAGTNAYYNGTNWIYKASTQASLYEQGDSAHKWYTAPSGTAGNAITFTQAMTLDASGNLGIGTTTPGVKLDVFGAQRIRQGTSSSTTMLQYTDNGGANNSYLSVYNAPDAWLFATSKNGTGTIKPIRFATNDFGNSTSGIALAIETNGNVGIGTSSPSASAILDAQSTTKGVRMPNMTTTQKNAISSPAAGLMVFDTTLAKLCVYSGSAWQTITSL